MKISVPERCEYLKKRLSDINKTISLNFGPEFYPLSRAAKVTTADRNAPVNRVAVCGKKSHQWLGNKLHNCP